MAIGVKVQNVIYDVDFTSLATETLADNGASFTLDSKTWYQTGQNAGNPTHSQIVNGTGLVIAPGSGSYMLGVKFSELDPNFSSSPFDQRYDVWFDYTRTGSSPASSTYGTGIVDPTQSGPYAVYLGFTNTTPTHEMVAFGTGYASVQTTTGTTTGVHVISLSNNRFFEGWTGSMDAGDFPDSSALTNISGTRLTTIDANVTSSNLAAGFFCNNVAGTELTVRRMRVIKVEG